MDKMTSISGNLRPLSLIRSSLIIIGIFLFVVLGLLRWRKVPANSPFYASPSAFDRERISRGKENFNANADADAVFVHYNHFENTKRDIPSVQTFHPRIPVTESLKVVSSHDQDEPPKNEQSGPFEFLNLQPGSDEVLETLYERLARKYLAPWLPMSNSDNTIIFKNTTALVTQRMLHLMEFVYKGGSFRVRFFQGKLLYRVLIKFQQTYRIDRMIWILSLFSEMIKESTLREPFDAIFYVGDGPKVAMDTFDKFAGFPLFSLRTSPVHIDIPIPDPVVYGSNGNYLWPTDARDHTSWEDKIPTAVFRGKASCLKMNADNWHLCNRVRAAKLSKELEKLASMPIRQHRYGNSHSEQGVLSTTPLLDIGITEWNQVRSISDGPIPIASDGFGLVQPPNQNEIEESTGLEQSPEMDYYEQSKFKYILELDGGLGSSRRTGILGSGSLLIAQKTPWENWFDPCLKPYYHYLPIDRYLHELPARVQWARDNDAKVRGMINAANDLNDRLLTKSSAKKYFAMLLKIYSLEMLAEKESIDDRVVPWDFCKITKNKDIHIGPMKCSQGWFTWNDLSSPLYWRSTIREINRKRKQSEDLL